MSDQNVTDVVLRTKVEGTPESLQNLDLLKAKIESMSGPVANGGQSNTPSGAPAWAPVPPSPYPPQQSIPPNQFEPLSGPPVPTSQYYTGGSQQAPYLAPGALAPRPDGAGGGGNGGSLAGGDLVPYDPGGGKAGGQWTMHIDTMNVIAQTVNIIGQNVNFAGGAGGGGGGGFGPGVPGAPAPGGGFGPGQFNINAPPVPVGGGGPSWQNFAQSVMRKPSISGIVGAVAQQMPLGSAAAVTAVGQFGNWMIDQELAAFAPQYHYETHLQAQREAGQFVHPFIATAEAKAAQGEGIIAQERLRLAPISWIPGIHQAAEIRFMEQERHIARLRARGVAQVREAHLSGITGVSTREFPMGEDGRPDPNMLDYREVGAEMLGPYGGAASRQFIPVPGGAETAAILKFGTDETLRAVGTMTQAGMDPTRPGLRASIMGGDSLRPGATLPPSVLSNAQMAASRGDLQTLYSLLPYFDAVGQRSTWENMVRIAHQMMDISGRGIIAGQVTQLATISGAGGAEVVGDIHRQVEIAGQSLQELIVARGAAPEGMKGDYDALINQKRIEIQQLHQQGAQTLYGREEQALSAQGMQASITQQRLLYQGVTGERAFAPIFQERGRVLIEQARVKEAESLRFDVYSPEQRAVFAQEARQLRTQANMEIPREAASLAFGQAEARAGFHGAEAGFAQTVAGLFGGPSERAAAVGQQERVVAEHLKNIQDRLDKGFLLDTERNQLLSEQKNLQGQAVQLAQQRIIGQLQGQFAVSQSEFGIGQTERGTAGIRGVGGITGEALGFGSVQRARQSLADADAIIAGLKSQGYAENSDEMLAARQKRASADQGLAQTEESLAHTQAPIGLRSALSQAGYRAQVLSMIPGSYGNLRGALQQEVSTLEKMAQTKQAEYAAVVQQYGGEENVPDHVKFGFQQELQQLGLQQAGAAQQLAYGWESRLISQTIGTPGSFGMYANRFSFRDAVGAGITNPHFGANRDQIPFFLRQAATVGSTAGSADPLGFAAGAMTGVHGPGGFSIGGVHGNNGIPGVAGGEHIDVNFPGVHHGTPAVGGGSFTGGGPGGGTNTGVSGTEETEMWLPSLADWEKWQRTGKSPYAGRPYSKDNIFNPATGKWTGTPTGVGADIHRSIDAAGNPLLHAATTTNQILTSMLHVMTGSHAAITPMTPDSSGAPLMAGDTHGVIAPMMPGAVTPIAPARGMPSVIAPMRGTAIAPMRVNSSSGAAHPYVPSPYPPHDPRFTSPWDGMNDPGANIGPHDDRLPHTYDGTPYGTIGPHVRGWRSPYDGMLMPGAGVSPHDRALPGTYDGMRYLKRDNFMQGGSHDSWTSPYDGTPTPPKQGDGRGARQSVDVNIKWPDGRSAGHVAINSADLTGDGLSNAIRNLFQS